VEIEAKFRVEQDTDEFLKKLRAYCAEAFDSCGEARRIGMVSVYYDTADNALHRAGVSLRFREEDGEGVVAVKAGTEKAGGLFERFEYEVCADTLEDGLAALSCGERIDALLKAKKEYVRVAEAEFTRLAFDVCGGDNAFEFALDEGFFGGDRERVFRELEIELKRGNRGELEGVAEAVARRFGLLREPRTKKNRAGLGERSNSGPALETDRLILREIRQSDYSALCAILQDPEVMYAYEGAFDDRETRDWFDKTLARYKNYGFGHWAVTLRENGAMIGQCGLLLKAIDGELLLEVGYLFNKDYWHKGYAIEAAAACKRYAFDVLGAGEVVSIIRDTNLDSMYVAIRNGMTVKKRIVKHYRGVDMPHLVFSAKRPT